MYANQIHRHRFLASYLLCLIRTGFQSPHHVLNDLVDDVTGFRPSGWFDETALKVKLAPLHGFDFNHLLSCEHLIVFSGVILISITDKHLLPVLTDIVLDCTFAGKIHRQSGLIADLMVEYGISRFKKEGAHTEAHTDEPITIRALVTFVERQQLQLERYLVHNLNSSNAMNAMYRGTMFKPPIPYLLTHAFSGPKHLSGVFEFNSPLGQAILSRASKVLQKPDQKRKLPDEIEEIEEASPKRPRVCTDRGISGSM